jgi:hypothetical protein
VRPRFFEPQKDPKEERDLAAERASVIQAQRAALLELAGRPALARDAEGLDAELKRTLQSVGYAAFATEGAEVPAPLAELALPDPMERTDELRASAPSASPPARTPRPSPAIPSTRTRRTASPGSGSR